MLNNIIRKKINYSYLQSKNIKLYSSELKDTISNLIPQRKQELQEIKNNYSDNVIDNVTTQQVIGGMRGIKSMLWDNSSLDSEKGITFHNKTIDEIRNELPKFYFSKHMKINTNEPMIEGMLWFLMTGKIPEPSQVENLRKE